MRSLSRTMVAAAMFCSALPLQAGDGEIYLAVLASRKHRLGASDNPVVGTFVSTDRGATWKHRGWREYIRTFHVEAGSDGTVWAACGNGVLRSTDGGDHWRVTTGWNVTEVLKVRPAAVDPRFVVAATAYGAIRSTDAGESWQPLSTGARRRFTSDVVIDRTSKRRILLAGEAGVALSLDGGRRWKETNLRVPTNVIIQHPVDPRVFWAGTEELGAFVSRDGGERWTQRNTPQVGKTIYAIAIDPVLPSRVFLGTFGGGVLRSDDGGLNWEVKGEGLLNRDVHSLCIVPGHPVVILAGTMNGGLFQSADGGETWTFNGHEDAQVWGLSLAPQRRPRP